MYMYMRENDKFHLVCRLIELYGREANLKLVAKELLPLQDVGPQKCLAFSVDGSRLATGGVVSFVECL